MTIGKHCLGCPLQKLGRGFALLDGKGRQGVLVVAEALGGDEANAGRPLVGTAGQLFDRMVYRTFDDELGRTLERDDFWLANVINCQPPNNELTKASYEHEAIEHCAPYLLETLDRLKPKVIFTMGNQPLRWFTGLWGIDSENLQGYVYHTKYGLVVPSYHPMFIGRGNYELVRVWQMALLKALYVARHGVPQLKKSYIPHPTVQQALEFRDRYLKVADQVLLGFDIETPESHLEKDEEWESAREDDASYTILMCSFSFEDGSGTTFPWVEPYISIARDILGSSGPKVVWNRFFDPPRLAHSGCPVNGRIYDGMDMAKVLEPSLRVSLKYVAPWYCPDVGAWHINEKREDKALYCVMDSDIARRCVIAMKQRLEQQNRWQLFERHYVDMGLVLDKMSSRGVAVDVNTRREARDRFQEKVTTLTREIDQMIPREAKPRTIYKYPEERLRKQGLWLDGSMFIVREQMSEKEYGRFLKKRSREEEAKRRSEQRRLEREEKQRLKQLGRELSQNKKQKKSRKLSVVSVEEE